MTPVRAGMVLLVRTGSTRLPAKSLLDVCGRPVLAHQIDRLKRSQRAEAIILATTTLPADDALVRVAEAAGIAVFRGSPEDVVVRLADAAVRFGLDFLAVAGGDDVFCEGEFIDAVIDEYARSRADFITIDNLPFGATPFGVSASGLRRVLEIRATDNTDGWERYFTETGLFQTKALVLPDPLLQHPEIRLDLDYPDDYELIKAIYARLYHPGEVPDLRAVLRLLLVQEPVLAQINRQAHAQWLANRGKSWPVLRLKPSVAPERVGA